MKKTPISSADVELTQPSGQHVVDGVEVVTIVGPDKARLTIRASEFNAERHLLWAESQASEDDPYPEIDA